jgi:hypothetical protein
MPTWIRTSPCRGSAAPLLKPRVPDLDHDVLGQVVPGSRSASTAFGGSFWNEFSPSSHISTNIRRHVASTRFGRSAKYSVDKPTSFLDGIIPAELEFRALTADRSRVLDQPTTASPGIASASGAVCAPAAA